MARVFCANFAIRGSLGAAADVADSAVQEAFVSTPVFTVQLFDAPEAPARKDGSLRVRGELHCGESIGLKAHRCRRGQRSEEAREECRHLESHGKDEE